MNKKIIILLLILAFILTSGFGCAKVDPAATRAMAPITLNYWSVWDSSDDFADIIAQYKQLHPFVNINYRKLRYDEYENALLEAFATDKGPDIFSIHNTWIRKYQSKELISPMPPAITMAFPVIQGKIKKQVVPQVQTNKTITLKKIKSDFVDAVYDDIVIKAKDPQTNVIAEKVFGLPLALDTLAMFYNKDLFNNANIANPPQYWNKEFQQDVKKLTKQDNKGLIIQSGVALGGGGNIERAGDILSVLMMQNGTQMLADNGTVTFNQRPAAFQDKNYNPGLDALRFYTDFANPAKEVYSWNNSLEKSLDLFIQGKLAMMFGYTYMIPQIKSRAPKLNFAIAPLPQIEGNPQSVNFANYWVESVSKKILTDPENLKQGGAYAKQKQDTAWDFIHFAASAERAKLYLAKTKKVTALRSLVNEQKEDEEIGEFAKQVLTAKSWYKGVDASAAELVIEEMINNAVLGQNSLENIINLGAQKVQQTIRPSGQ